MENWHEFPLPGGKLIGKDFWRRPLHKRRHLQGRQCPARWSLFIPAGLPQWTLGSVLGQNWNWVRIKRIYHPARSGHGSGGTSGLWLAAGGRGNQDHSGSLSGYFAADWRKIQISHPAKPLIVGDSWDTNRLQTWQIFGKIHLQTHGGNAAGRAGSIRRMRREYWGIGRKTAAAAVDSHRVVSHRLPLQLLSGGVLERWALEFNIQIYEIGGETRNQYDPNSIMDTTAGYRRRRRAPHGATAGNQRKRW